MPALPPVVHEDDSLIAVDKPAGLAVAPDPRKRGAANLLEALRRQWGPAVMLVHRIDDEASGLVVAARDKAALDALSGQFQAKTVAAAYDVLAAGAPLADTGRIELALAEDPAQPGRMIPTKRRGQGAVTDFTVRRRFGRFAEIECRPGTFRRHQIRVHLAASGAPVLNDELYGHGQRLLLSDLKRGYKGRENEQPLLRRLALHAARLRLVHPATGLPLELAAPLPKDFAIALRNLGKYAQ